MQIKAVNSRCSLHKATNGQCAVAPMSGRALRRAPCIRVAETSFRTRPRLDVSGERGHLVVCSAGLFREVDKLKDKLSDLGDKERLDVLDKFYRDNLTKEGLETIIADNFKMGEEGYSRVFTKGDYIGLMAGSVLPAIPDFKWGHATNGEVDRDGYCIVTVQATGHHTGAPLVMPGLEPLPPSGKRFCLAEEVQKVKVANGKVVEIQVLPTKGAGPRALYKALGGKLPPSKESIDETVPPAP